MYHYLRRCILLFLTKVSGEPLGGRWFGRCGASKYIYFHVCMCEWAGLRERKILSSNLHFVKSSDFQEQKNEDWKNNMGCKTPSSSVRLPSYWVRIRQALLKEVMGTVTFPMLVGTGGCIHCFENDTCCQQVFVVHYKCTSITLVVTGERRRRATSICEYFGSDTGEFFFAPFYIEDGKYYMG